MAAIRFYRHLIFIIILIAGVGFQTTAQDNIEDISQALNDGNAKALSIHFSKSVDIGLPEKDQEYRSSQGEIVMEEFFELYPPDSFMVKQQGSNDALSSFFIGKYLSSGKQFQVLVILKKEDDNYLIHKLKFELDDQQPDGQ